jgi:hypothetical protein
MLTAFGVVGLYYWRLSSSVLSCISSNILLGASSICCIVVSFPAALAVVLAGGLAAALAAALAARLTSYTTSFSPLPSSAIG